MKIFNSMAPFTHPGYPARARLADPPFRGARKRVGKLINPCPGLTWQKQAGFRQALHFPHGVLQYAGR